MDRNDKIDRLLDQVDDWDLDNLIDFAKECRLKALEKLDDKELDALYEDEING